QPEPTPPQGGGTSGGVAPPQASPVSPTGPDQPVSSDNEPVVTDTDTTPDDSFTGDREPAVVTEQTESASDQNYDGSTMLIAGGAILALLVIVVAIALLIRRLRSDKNEPPAPTQGWNNW